MQTISQTYKANYITAPKSQSLIFKFFAWCNSQQEYQYGWLAVIVALHGCVLAPITALVIIATGNSLIGWAAVAGAMAMSLTTNLSAMPTRITIPVFVLSVLIDLVVITGSLASYFAA